jgi:hypothetical protein
MRKADALIPWKSCRELDIMVIFRDIMSNLQMG